MKIILQEAKRERQRAAHLLFLEAFPKLAFWDVSHSLPRSDLVFLHFRQAASKLTCSNSR